MVGVAEDDLEAAFQVFFVRGGGYWAGAVGSWTGWRTSTGRS